MRRVLGNLEFMGPIMGCNTGVRHHSVPQRYGAHRPLRGRGGREGWGGRAVTVAAVVAVIVLRATAVAGVAAVVGGCGRGEVHGSGSL